MEREKNARKWGEGGAQWGGEGAARRGRRRLPDDGGSRGARWDTKWVLDARPGVLESTTSIAVVLEIVESPAVHRY